MQIKTIKLLPPELTNQIAAGEVVERPASVVKELMENSLDAGATHIDVDIENGGQTRICVIDDGCGIPPDQLELAVTRHATSKLSRLEDLQNITSYGFRGEALPSIASVSRFSITSAYKDQKEKCEASSLEVVFSKIQSVAPSAWSKGTKIEIKELFANTPARLKFLKTPATELKKVQEIFIRLALVCENVGFILRSGSRELLRFEPHMNLIQRLSVIWPPVIIEALKPFKEKFGNIELFGFASDPTSSQPRSDRMLFYVNGRAVNDKLIMHAVRQAYQGHMTSRDYPQIILFLNLPPDEVDVNVHPAKNEVRFRDEKSLFSAILHTLENVFSSIPQVSDIMVAHEESYQQTDQKEEKHPRGFWGKYDTPQVLPQKIQEPQSHYFREDSHADFFSGTALERKVSEDNTQEKSFFPAVSEPTSLPLDYKAESANETCSEPIGLTYLGQIASTYLVCTKQDNTLIILDQHAVHERIFFEKFRNQGERGVSKQLLVPLTISLHQTEQQRFIEVQENIEKLGFELSCSNSVCLIKALPPEMDRQAALLFIKEALADKIDDLSNLWIRHACATAIRAGQSLTPDDARQLITQWLKTEEPDFCPHGRPCALSFDKEQLEKLFKRRQN